MSKKAKEKGQLGFGEKMKALEAIVERLESDELQLEEALAAFEEGIRLSRELRTSLTAAQKKVEILLQGAKGETETEPFDPGSFAPSEGEE